MKFANVMINFKLRHVPKTCCFTKKEPFSDSGTEDLIFAALLNLLLNYNWCTGLVLSMHIAHFFFSGWSLKSKVLLHG